MKTCIKLLAGFLSFLPFAAKADYLKPSDVIYLRGSIDTLKVEMTLHFNQESARLDGFYRYIGRNSWLSIDGSFDEHNSLVLDEFPYQDGEPSINASGKFIGDLSKDNLFVGTWENPKKSRTYRFTLVPDDNGNGLSFNGGYSKTDSTMGDYNSSCEITYLRPYSKDQQLAMQLDTFIYNRLFCAEDWADTVAKPVYPDYSDITSNFVLSNANPEYSTDWDAGASVVWNGNGILSMVNSNWEYSGGAHGCGYDAYNCFDLKTGKRIEEKDIFLPGYEEVLRKKAIKHLDAMDGELFMPLDSLQLNGNFYVTPEGIGYFYNPYEIACYACGTPSAFIPWSEINSYIDPKGPMGWVRR